MINSKKSLAVALSKLEGFTRPKMSLEQYPTPSEAAATVLWFAGMNGDIQGKNIADFGAGFGVLGVGAQLLGAKSVCCIEKDSEAVCVLKRNLEALELTGVQVLIEDVTSSDVDVDVVVMNPPFGTKQRHADLVFLRKAFQSAPVVYSFHKRSTDEHIATVAHQEGFMSTKLFLFTFLLPKTMSEHKKALHGVEITVWRFQKSSTKGL